MSVAYDPTGRAAHPAGRGRRAALLSLRTVRPDLVEVTLRGQCLGYVEIVGHVFVVLQGERYDLAVEILQTMSIEDATNALQATAA